jgi:hypothetical protein
VQGGAGHPGEQGGGQEKNNGKMAIQGVAGPKKHPKMTQFRVEAWSNMLRSLCLSFGWLCSQTATIVKKYIFMNGQ